MKRTNKIHKPRNQENSMKIKGAFCKITEMIIVILFLATRKYKTVKSPAAAAGLGVSRIKGLVSVTLTVTLPPETVKAADSGCFPTL